MGRMKNDFNVDVIDYRVNKNFVSADLQFSRRVAQIIEENLKDGESLEAAAYEAWECAKKLNFISKDEAKPTVMLLNQDPYQLRVVSDPTVIYLFVQKIAEE